MPWKRISHLFRPKEYGPWTYSHASNPFPEHVGGDDYRIYFNSRDTQNRSVIGYVLVNLSQPDRILDISSSPLLGPGDCGLFDDSGVSIGNMVVHGRARYLFYTGWSLRVTVPWANAVGLAVATNPLDEPAEFVKHSRAPIVDRSEIDPFNISYPWVLHDGSRWRMWYGSNIAATPHDKREIPHVIRHAESDDGITWTRSNTICVGGGLSGVCAFSKPCVIRDSTVWRMWYCYRGELYRIGYAESSDGITWTRADSKSGLLPDGNGWESMSTAYPAVFDHDGNRFMLYNGNGYGETGFGLAVEV